MSYSIIKSDGSILTTIPDGTVNNTSTSVSLFGRDYPTWGQLVDTNFVHQLENFAAPTPPINPLRGQLWYNTVTSTLNVCPADGTSNAAAWTTLSATGSAGTTTFGNVTVTGNIAGNIATFTGNVTTGNVSTSSISITTNASIANASITGNAIINGSLRSATINAGTAANSTGTLNGVWTVNGSGVANGVNGISTYVTGGNLLISGAGNVGIRTDNYYYANGVAINFAGTYGNSNVQALLASYTGNVGATGSSTILNARTLSTGANSTVGTITGTWQLSAGSRLTATWADLAERFESDEIYPTGTLVTVGGEKEITIVKDDLDSNVLGVISESAAYILNDSYSDDPYYLPVALVGRIPVRVTGPVRKGDRLVSAGNGLAKTASNSQTVSSFQVIGRALEDVDENGSLVTAVVRINP